MKKTVLAAIVFASLIGIGTGSAFAAGNDLNKGSKSLGFGIVGAPFNTNTTQITGAYFLEKDLSVIGGFGLQLRSGDAKGTEFDVMAGLRKYLKVDDFAPFVQGAVGYASSTVDKGTDTSTFFAAGAFGAEYFLAKHFSIEGSAGISLASQTDKPTGGSSQTTTAFGTQNYGLFANFYF